MNFEHWKIHAKSKYLTNTMRSLKTIVSLVKYISKIRINLGYKRREEKAYCANEYLLSNDPRTLYERVRGVK